MQLACQCYVCEGETDIFSSSLILLIIFRLGHRFPQCVSASICHACLGRPYVRGVTRERSRGL
jgi:hypothetical protein